MSAILVDTNILVYPHDPRDRNKQEHARRILDRLVKSRQATVSVQCLTEFFRSVRWRLPEPLDPGDAIAQIDRIAINCRVLNLTFRVVMEACRASISYQMSIWDALIWAVAKVNEVPYILSEDAVHGRLLDGITYINPFDDQFDAAVLDRI